MKSLTIVIKTNLEIYINLTNNFISICPLNSKRDGLIFDLTKALRDVTEHGFYFNVDELTVLLKDECFKLVTGSYDDELNKVTIKEQLKTINVLNKIMTEDKFQYVTASNKYL